MNSKPQQQAALAAAFEGLIKGGMRYASADRRTEETVENKRREGRQLNEDEVWEGMERGRAEDRLIWRIYEDQRVLYVLRSGKKKRDKRMNKAQKEKTDMIKRVTFTELFCVSGRSSV